MLHHPSLPLKFGDFAFCTAVYLINRLPTASLNFSVPYHMLFHKHPDYTFLRTFGCACFPLPRPYNTHKLDFRSHECLFLGYSSSRKGYKCLSPSGGIYISKDVLFNESEFPYTTLFESPSSPSHPTSSTQYQFLPIPNSRGWVVPENGGHDSGERWPAAVCETGINKGVNKISDDHTKLYL